LILGDLNCNALSPQLSECCLFRNFASSFELHDMFSEPTRITDSSASHLDVFLTNCTFSFIDVTALPVGFSDHHIVVGTYLTRRFRQPVGHTYINARPYRKLDPALLQTIYSDEIWNDVLSFDNVSDAVECFTIVLQELHRVRIKQHTSPWAADSEVIAARCKRDEAHRQALKTGDPLLWQEYRSARNKANKLLRKAKYSYLSKLTSSTSGNFSKFWSHFHYMSRRGSHPSDKFELHP